MPKTKLIKADHPILQEDLAAKQSFQISEAYNQHYATNMPHDMVGEKNAMRRHILSLSLFPNLYNKRFVYSSEGPD
jgi:hypothetical protein